jgi:1-acyl-sn-glycerol-3-phosphate acyltransferase
MTDHPGTINYPRRIIVRSLLRNIGRLLIPLLFRVSIEGKNRFPSTGPLIVVGNHTAIMEAVLLNVYSPWQIEMMGAADIPHERLSQFFIDLYGDIPVKRGRFDRSALRNGLRILHQQGIIGIFPEGGIWEPGLMRAQTGVAWLSYHGKTPVLPIGFSGTLGSLERAKKLTRPKLRMKVGEIIPPLEGNREVPRKVLFHNYAEEIMARVRNLILPTDPSIQEFIVNERFNLSLIVKDKDHNTIQIPDDKRIFHGASLAKLLHRPAIMKLFYDNLNLPIDALLDLSKTQDPLAISKAVGLILKYLENENPYLLIYRFGPKIGEEMKLGLLEVSIVSEWATMNGYRLFITPIRKFFSLKENKEIAQTKPDKFENWM